MDRWHVRSGFARLLIALFAFSSGASLAQIRTIDRIDGKFRESVDQISKQVLATTGVPSASIAIVVNGQIAYVQAYGDASVEPRVPARPHMRYSIGSISKQFTATAILLLAEQHKLSLEDPISRFFPTLTRANEVTIRELLSHTSGYRDYWPQDYVPPFMLSDTTSEQILDRFARTPLDFDPGTQWQYSNTNFVIAGLIVEKVSGMPLLNFLAERVFTPLGMKSIANVDAGRLGETDATGYLRYALGPPRIAPKEAKGWLFAAAELGMTAQNLAEWDIAMMNRRLLQPASYKEMQSEVLLKDGRSTRYGLGIGIRSEGGHRILAHGGEVSGFGSENIVFPDDQASVTVLTNVDMSDAASEISQRIAGLLFVPEQQGEQKNQQQIEKIFQQFQRGTIDRSLFTANANSYFNQQAVADFAEGLAPLGTPQEFTQTEREDRGGMIFRRYSVKFGQKTLDLWIRQMPDGKIEQYQIAVKP
ncbi:MAG TPA: serine hydrolase domain-containing protein [Candidatus Angelobacter sp.]|jgi:D-alanyl-D-alanine carboxypeptidase|nr:serine hydrolase domain-containing protein [Candidatus Angelobacter sp.]